MEDTTWIQSATASVITMVGTLTVAVLKNMPIQPDNPIVVTILPTITTRVAKVPTKVRRANHMITIMVKNISGTMVEASCFADAAKASFINTTPV